MHLFIGERLVAHLSIVWTRKLAGSKAPDLLLEDRERCR